MCVYRVCVHARACVRKHAQTRTCAHACVSILCVCVCVYIVFVSVCNNNSVG